MSTADTDRRTGLSSDEARSRLAADRPNELPRATRRSLPRVVVDVLREPMLALLLAGGIAYLLLGSLTEALILIAFALFSIGVTVVQEARTEGVLEALRDLSAPRALVIRDGAPVRIAGREVVCGDLLVLAQGDRIAADAELVEAVELQADESLLTGESVPVSKRVGTAGAPAGDADARRPGGDDQPYVYAGSLVARGSGIARVVATGARSQMGLIGRALETLETAAPRLQAQTRRVVAWCAAGGAVVALLVVVLYGLFRGSWLEALLAGIAIGMSMLPEEFPVVLTVFLAMGAWRIGKVGVLTRRAAAIETLGSATVLCTDKTGTLTENRMSVAALWLPSGEAAAPGTGTPLAPAFRALLRIAALASAPVPSDPMETALLAARTAAEPGDDAAGTTAAGGDGGAGGDGELVHAYPLRPELLAMSNAWQSGDRVLLAAKGAPEAIAGLCRLEPAAKASLTAAAEALGARGIRVLAVASATPAGPGWAPSQVDYPYQLVGLVGFADPLRGTVPAAVAECRAAGIRVVMITGDHAVTARAIATQAGIAAGDVLAGGELDALDAAGLAARLDHVTVFARITPQQKLRIVEAFKAEGQVVAMTGDGVNDAPSLKAAHIGVAMGKRGTDVAREASAIVLVDDDFGAIVQAVRLGRRIYDNLRKAMAFIFAVHVPIAGLALLPLFFGLPILLGPIHIALLELVIDPVCALVFEAERDEDDLMRRPPRDPAEPLFAFSLVAWSVFQGCVAFAMLATVFLVESRLGMPAAEIRALVFFALVAELLALILVNRSFSTSLGQALFRRNAALAYVFLAVATITGVILYWGRARELLQFGAIDRQHMALAAGLGVLLLLVLEACKPVARRLLARPPGIRASRGA